MSESLHKNHDRYFVPGLSRGLRVLEIIAEADKPLTIVEISKKLGVSRSSAFRITYTLRHMGFLSTDKGDKVFDLGPRILNLGFSYLNRQDIIKIAKPFLEKLSEQTKVSCHLAVKEGREVLYLDNVLSKSSFVSNISTGARTPVYSCPLGWVMLINLDDATITKLFAETKFAPLTEHTPKNINDLIGRIRQAGKDGFVISRGFMQRGGSMIAAPVFNETGDVVAAIDISGPDSGFDLNRLQEFYLPKVIEAAAKISLNLGYRL